MKHLKTFEAYSTEETINEFWGTPNPVEKQRVEGEIDQAIAKYNENPAAFAKQDVVKLKANLLKSASDNKFKGNVLIKTQTGDRNTPNYGKKFIIYNRKLTGLQNIGQAASGAYSDYF